MPINSTKPESACNTSTAIAIACGMTASMPSNYVHPPALSKAGCKVAVGTRLKRAGMQWTVRGSNATIALRCCKLSGRFQDFWERRSDARRAT